MKTHVIKQADLAQAADCQSATLLYSLMQFIEEMHENQNQKLTSVRMFVMNMTKLKRILACF